MNKVRMAHSIAAVAAALALGACSGDGSTLKFTTPGKSVTGVVTGFGSVFVNGVEYDTASSSVTLDGQPGDEAGLAVGMVVTLQGSVDDGGATGVATRIDFRDQTEGLVLANTIAAGATAGTMNVMGQTVSIDGATVFESDDQAIVTVDQVPANALVEVSGYPDGQGGITATRIELKKAAFQNGDTIEVKGVVTNLAASDKSFTLGGLSVDYSQANLEVTLGNDLYVQVSAKTAPVDGGNGSYTLAATQVEIEDDGAYGLNGEEGEEIELQGVITAVDAVARTVALNGQTISVVDSEIPLADIQKGQRACVEGHFDANGLLIGDKLELEEQGDIEIFAAAESIDSAAGSVTVLGQPIKVATATMMMDRQGPNPVRYFDLSDISAGDYLEVAAYSDPSGALVAAKLKREESPGAEVLLKGPVTQESPLRVAGVAVSFDACPACQGVLVTLGTRLEIVGAFSGGTLNATGAKAD